jgi:hypothetical protein
MLRPKGSNPKINKTFLAVFARLQVAGSMLDRDRH